MIPRAPLALLTVVLAALVSFTGGTATAAPAYEYPTWPTSPLGANDWDCRPTAERPYPAVIVHGTFGDARSLLDHMSLALEQDGYCVYSLDYGNRATGPIEESAQQLDIFVDEVLAATGAAKVQLVGHSQGGMTPRHWIKNPGRRAAGGGPRPPRAVQPRHHRHAATHPGAAGAPPATSRRPARPS